MNMVLPKAQKVNMRLHVFALFCFNGETYARQSHSLFAVNLSFLGSSFSFGRNYIQAQKQAHQHCIRMNGP